MCPGVAWRCDTAPVNASDTSRIKLGLPLRSLGTLGGGEAGALGLVPRCGFQRSADVSRPANAERPTARTTEPGESPAYPGNECPRVRDSYVHRLLHGD